MTKKIYTFVLCFSFIGLVFGAGLIKAQTDVGLPSPGLTPDSPFYFLERIFEGIGTFFTFGDVAKAKRYAELAAERIAEAKAVVDKGKPEAAEKALARYQDQLKKSLAKAEQALAKGKSVSEVVEIVAQATAKHLTVLEEVLERVPEKAKSAVLQAREVSKTGQIKALEGLSKEKPERAVQLNIQAIQNRLERIKNKAQEGDEQGAERIITDFSALRTSLEKIGKENKMILASLVAEVMTEQIEDLDETEDILKNLSPQIAEKIKAVKINAINGHVDVLRSLAEVDPEKAVEIFSIAAEKRLNKAKQSAQEEDAEETEEAIEEFEKYAAFGQEISEIAQAIGKDTTKVEQLVGRATTHHLEVLNDVYNKVPEQAKEAIQKAMTVSEIGRQKAVEALKEKGVLLEDIPEIVPIPRKVKEKVKVFKEKGIFKRPIPKREEIKKPEVERLEKQEVEKPKIEKHKVKEIEKPKVEEIEVEEIERPKTKEPELEIPEISPGPPGR